MLKMFYPLVPFYLKISVVLANFGRTCQNGSLQYAGMFSCFSFHSSSSMGTVLFLGFYTIVSDGLRALRVVQSLDSTHMPFYFWNQCRKEADPTYNDSESILNQSRNLSFNFRIVVYRIRLFPTSNSKIKPLGYELPLTINVISTHLVRMCLF